MKLPIARGFNVLRQDEVRIMHFDVRQGAQEPIAWAESLPDWEVQLPLNVRLDIETDFSTIPERLGLHSTARFGLLLRWMSRGSGIGGASDVVPVEDSHTGIETDIDSALLALDLSLRAIVVLLDPGIPTDDRFAPHRPGSILWSKQLRIELEGDDSRVPMATADFSKLQFNTGGNAVWYLELRHSDFDESAASAICVWLNAENEVVQTLLDGDDEIRRPLQKLIMAGITRQIADIGIQNEEFLIDHPYEAGTLGAMIQKHLNPISGVGSVREMAKEQPHSFEAQIQSYVWRFMK